jgi:hypothetical protein
MAQLAWKRLEFLLKFESRKGWTLRDIEFTIAITSVHQPR